MRIHENGASPRRVAAALSLVAALAPAAVSAEEDARISGGEKMDVFEKILDERVAKGEISARDAPDRSSVVGGRMDLSPEACFTEEAPGLEAEVRGGVRDASLMLLATYETVDGTPAFSYGTGTVVSAEDGGVNRVLTASHVSSPTMLMGDDTTAELQSVHAFSQDGRLVAQLSPAYANREVMDLADEGQDLIHDDVTVLAPTRFASPEMAASWDARGLPVANEQSENLLFFHGEGGETTLNTGYSGASLVNADGAIVGVVTEIVAHENSVSPAPDTPMPEAIGNHQVDGLGRNVQNAVDFMMNLPHQSRRLEGVSASRHAA